MKSLCVCSVLLFVSGQAVCENFFDGQRAVQIVDTNDYDTFIFKDEVLKDILLADDVKDRLVCVVSIAGGFREGKSFLLNFLLRYLHVKYTLRQPTHDWLNSKYGPVQGFSWKTGSKTNTTGIVMWSNIFLTELNSGEKVAIILLDTQGAFDNQNTYKQSGAIFALSTLASSIQIYNVVRNVDQEKIKNLEFFAGYGRYFNQNSRPFQDLMFLVRDWSFPHEKIYGMDGGDELLKEVFKNADATDFQDLFEKISCFLMPHPGKSVAESPSFKGDMTEISIPFREYARLLAAYIFDEENLILKSQNGEKIRAKEWVYYLEEYMHIFKTSNVPELPAILMATTEASFRTLLDDCMSAYELIMGKGEYFDQDVEWENLHLTAKTEAEKCFARKGNAETQKKIAQIYKRKLDRKITELYKQIKQYNQLHKEKISRYRVSVISSTLLGIAVTLTILYYLDCFPKMKKVNKTKHRNKKRNGKKNVDEEKTKLYTRSDHEAAPNTEKREAKAKENFKDAEE